MLDCGQACMAENRYCINRPYMLRATVEAYGVVGIVKSGSVCRNTDNAASQWKV
jgi:hypothetical protein